MDYLYSRAEAYVEQYGTRDPYELLNGIGARVIVTHDFEPDGLKGFAAIENRMMYAVINGKLNKHEQHIIAGHEAAHLINHEAEILASPARAMQDFDLYCNKGRLENEANRFLADFLTGDEEVLDMLSSHDGFYDLASVLYLPPPLLGFKLYSMMQRGLPVKSPVDLKSDFLAQN